MIRTVPRLTYAQRADASGQSIRRAVSKPHALQHLYVIARLESQ